MFLLNGATQQEVKKQESKCLLQKNTQMENDRSYRVSHIELGPDSTFSCCHVLQRTILCNYSARCGHNFIPIDVIAAKDLHVAIVTLVTE